MFWVAIIYLLLKVERAPVIWGVGADSKGQNPFSEIETRISANLSNQFEWSVLFYVIRAILITHPRVLPGVSTVAGLVFVIGHVIHSVVQTSTTNIQLRGTVFNINFLAVLAIWGM